MYKLSTSYIPRFVQEFSYIAPKHTPHINGILTAPGGHEGGGVAAKSNQMLI